MNGYDGFIVIGTKVDSKQLEKDLKNQKKELKKFATEEEKLLKQKEKAELDLSDYYEQKRLIEENTNEFLKHAQTQKEVNMQLDNERRLLENLNEKYSSQIQNLDVINNKITANKNNQETMKQKIADTESQLKKTKGYEKIKDNIDDVNSSIGKTIKKVGKWSLAVFGLRTAYNGIRSAVSTLSQYDEQLATNIDYIKYALAMSMKPIIEWIVDAVYQLLGYVNYISKAWFNVDLFANASAKNMNKANKSAKELKKTLLGFDEINVLQENGNVESTIAPSFDLSNMEDVDAPAWLKWIADNKDKVLEFASAVAILIGSSKLLTGLAGLSSILGTMATIGVISIGVSLLYTALTGRELVQDLKDIWDGMNDLKILSEETSSSSDKLTGANYQLIDSYKQLEEQGGATTEQTDVYVNSLLNTISSNNDLVNGLEDQKTILGELNGANANLTEAQDKYNQSTNDTIKELERLYTNGTLNDEQKKKYIETIKEEMRKLREEDTHLTSNSEKYKQNENRIKDLNDSLKKLTGEDYKISLDADMSTAKSKLAGFFEKLDQFGILNTVLPGWNIANLVSSIKHMATGGIINVPGRGIPLANNVVGGEAGAEGVLPLTNPNTMSQLGQEIGKWITLNIDLTNTIDGRVLNKRLETIKNNNSFIRNGG